ncbi:MAG: alkaline phosphatase D family protein [Bacteroidota bacterium]
MKQFFFTLLALVFIFSACQQKETRSPYQDDGNSQYWDEAMAPFYHSVASGDPLEDAVIIWTRITPEFEGTVEGKWMVAKDVNMTEVVKEGTFETDVDKDYTVKVDVTGLETNTYYYYQFEALEKKSPVGRTKTIPEGTVDQLQFAIVSCSNFEAGFFNAFGRIAELENIDAVLHLGDYIYEYAQGVYGDTTLGRLHLPNKEIIELQDYRTRYSQYRLDEDFQKAHQMHPFITIWDDHEITNNSYQTGAQNHQPEEEGDYNIRKGLARQAYYEWLPIRDNEEKHLYRSFSYGNLVDLIMLDERLAGRSAQVDSITQAGFDSPERSMLGKEQLAWFKEELSNSDAQWKLIGNLVIFSKLDISALGWRGVINTDAWDGYPAEQNDIISYIKSNKIENVIFVTGDTHRAWAFEVPETIDAYKVDSTATVAIEFGATSITSANTDERVGVDTVLMIEKRSMDPEYNPHMKYNNQRDHGYILLTLSSSEATAQFRVVQSIREKTPVEKTDKTISVKSGSHDLVVQ